VVVSTAADLGREAGAVMDEGDAFAPACCGGVGIVAPCGNHELSEAATRLAVSATVASPIKPVTALLATVLVHA
jgi:hypothetical protein